MEDFKTEKEFLKCIGMDESFIAVGRQRVYPLEMLADFKQHLIDTREMVPAEKWMSCEDQLPEIGQFVLVYRIEGYYSVDQYRQLHGETKSFSYNVTHWMPLPPAPGEHNTKS